MGSVLVGGKDVPTTTWYTWDLSVSRSRQVGQVGNNNASFAATGLSYSNCQNPPSTTNIYMPQWSPTCFTEAYNPSSFRLSDVAVNKGMTAQLNLQATGAMAKRYHLGSRLATIEIGGKFRNAHKFDNEFVLDWAPNAATISMTQFSNKFTNNNYYGGAYKLGPNPPFPDLFPFVQSNLSLFTTTTDQGGNSANFDLIEKVPAGYSMHPLDISSRWRLIAGVRFEGTNLDTSSFQTPTSCNIPLPPTGCPSANTVTTSGFVKANGSYVKVLPSASLRYALTNNTNLRVAYARGLSRPNPQDIAQARTIDSTVNPNVVSLGNPNLKPESADNVDVLVEHSINPFGLITAGYFYKNLVNPIVEHTCGNPTPCPAPFTGDIVKQPLNAGSAWIHGFEAAYLQHLTFLPGMFSGLGLSANYGYTASRASLGPDFQRTHHPRLLRNAPHTWNISPTYDRGRLSMRVGLSYNAANIAGYGFSDGAYGGINGPLGDNYFYAHLQFDAQGSVRMGHGLSFVMYGLNINNEVFGFYNGSPQYMVQREFYQPTIAAGMRWSPLHEK